MDAPTPRGCASLRSATCQQAYAVHPRPSDRKSQGCVHDSKNEQIAVMTIGGQQDVGVVPVHRDSCGEQRRQQCGGEDQMRQVPKKGKTYCPPADTRRRAPSRAAECPLSSRRRRKSRQTPCTAAEAGVAVSTGNRATMRPAEGRHRRGFSPAETRPDGPSPACGRERPAARPRAGRAGPRAAPR